MHNYLTEESLPCIGQIIMGTILAAQWKKRFPSVTTVDSLSMTDPHIQRIIVFFYFCEETLHDQGK